MKKIAVIMSLYKNDRVEFLKQSIESILQQTYPNFDLYIQCDGVIKKECKHYLYSLKDERICLRERDENKGLAKSLNELLIEEVLPKKYEYIARMDADDICVSNRFERQIAFLESKQEVDIVGGFINEIDENGLFMQKVTYPTSHDKMKSFFGKRNPLAHMTVMFRDSYFEKAGIYPEYTNLDEDTMFWFQGFQNKCIFSNLEEVMVNVRVNAEFYGRRNGVKKSYGDLKNRFKIIKELHLSYINYFFAVGRFILMSLPFANFTKFLYKKTR